jgi:hypothetical protein
MNQQDQLVIGPIPRSLHDLIHRELHDGMIGASTSRATVRFSCKRSGAEKHPPHPTSPPRTHRTVLLRVFAATDELRTRSLVRATEL